MAAEGAQVPHQRHRSALTRVLAIVLALVLAATAVIAGREIVRLRSAVGRLQANADVASTASDTAATGEADYRQSTQRQLDALQFEVSGPTGIEATITKLITAINGVEQQVASLSSNTVSAADLADLENRLTDMQVQLRRLCASSPFGC